MRNTPEALLLRHVLETPEGAIPGEARAAACRFAFDALAVGVAGTAHPAQPGVIAAARRWGSGAEASVWGEDLRLPAPQAAFVNAFQAHALEFDAIHEGAVVHAMTPTLSAAVAEAERQGALGRPVPGARFVAAIVAGIELACVIGAAARGPMRFFRPATAGMFGAYGAVARLRGFDAAMGTAGAGLMIGQIPGTMQAHHEGSVALAVQMGFAAAAAFRAADLAEAGLSGPQAWLTGASGFLALTEPEHDLAPGLAALGAPWQVTRLSHKPFPSGRLTHPAIDGVQRLLARGWIDAALIEEVVLHLPPLATRLVGRPLVSPLTPNYARLCLPYVVATTLRRATVDLADFSEARVTDAQTLALAARVTMREDGTTDQNAVVPQAVELRMAGGRIERVVVEAAIGSPERPLSDDAQIAKAEACVAASRHGFAPAAVRDVLGRVLGLAQETDAGILGRLYAVQ
ncbi:MmgE/PrpD family protein [Roseomonas sp. PWR1]|uniref:MmgE/PrpD family protein n=1 Tax=Roseomonas nitratireducens TaxID=2820810 RepID=A0ABS4AP54_9PROT|nr:MmgE/PrpD family protein [Neoroseomonas nitratireducens]MBP0463144.1 MmgE/PrpD family protein [Neoroseomonas nitratireducens]